MATPRRTTDNRVCVLAIPKAEPGERWRRLFRGDSDGARCMQPPYTLTGARLARAGPVMCMQLPVPQRRPLHAHKHTHRPPNQPRPPHTISIARRDGGRGAAGGGAALLDGAGRRGGALWPGPAGSGRAQRPAPAPHLLAQQVRCRMGVWGGGRKAGGVCRKGALRHPAELAAVAARLVAAQPPAPATCPDPPANCRREEAARRRDYCVVEEPECVWSLEDDVGADGERCRLLVVTLARPDPTEEEVAYKKGAPCWLALQPGERDGMCHRCLPAPHMPATAPQQRRCCRGALHTQRPPARLPPARPQASGRTTAPRRAPDRCTKRAGASLQMTRMSLGWRRCCRCGVPSSHEAWGSAAGGG